MQHLLGIDLGTSAVKVLLVSETVAVAVAASASASAEYPLITPRPNWAEQDPERWWEEVCTAVRDCLERYRAEHGHDPAVAAVGLSGQMHGSVFLDGRGTVLRPAILWCDQRTGAQCRATTEALGVERLIELTANQALAGFTAPKVLWLRQNEPDVYARVTRLLLPKDYIRYRLTGAFATEVSDASGTLLFDVVARRWSLPVLEALEIPRSWLPDCFESPVVSAYVSQEAAGIVGIPAGTPVVGGGGDQAAGAVGSGIVREGLASYALGTSGVLFWHCDEPLTDPLGRLHFFCHAVPGKWQLMAVTLSAGGSLRWFRDTLCQDLVEAGHKTGANPYEVITAGAAGVPPGCEGLLFLPYLSGERTPHADVNARGAFLGLSLRHTREHLARAVMEGVCLSMRDCLELGKECGMNTAAVHLSGGSARSLLWQQLVADVLGVEAARLNVDQGPAYGAAILASVGAGLYTTVEEACAALIRVVEHSSPDPPTRALYDQLYRLYRPLYSSLKDFFNASAALSEFR